MSSPSTTDNPQSLMPARMVFRCTDGGAADTRFVEAVCTSSGQLLGASQQIAPRTVGFTSDPFPVNSSITLAQGKILYTTFSSALTSLSGSFVIDAVNVLDRTALGLNVDIYLGIGDITTYRALWNATPAAGNYGYLTGLTGGQIIGVIKVRTADYTAQYSGAGVMPSKACTKLVAYPFTIPTSGSKSLHCVVISADTSTATMAQYAMDLGVVIRMGG